jgi:hypothetical protein
LTNKYKNFKNDFLLESANYYAEGEKKQKRKKQESIELGASIEKLIKKKQSFYKLKHIIEIIKT